MRFLEDHIRSQRMASRRCSYLSPDLSLLRGSTTSISYPPQGWSQWWLAERSGLLTLAVEHLSVPTDKGVIAGRKIGSLVAGMIAGADSITDMALLRHGAMKTLFDRPTHPRRWVRWCASLTFGHVRQLDAVATRFLRRLAEHTPIAAGVAGVDGRVMIDIDDLIIEVHGHSKQGSRYGYSGVRGLNSLITTLTTSATAPVIVGQRLRKGSCGSSRGATRMIADTLTTVGRMRAAAATSATTSDNGDEVQLVPKPLVRADSAFFGYSTIGAAVRGGSDVSVATGPNSVIRTAISVFSDDAGTPIEYTHAIFDEQTQRWISVAEVAEIPFTAFA